MVRREVMDIPILESLWFQVQQCRQRRTAFRELFKIIEDSSDGTGTTFRWQRFAKGGEAGAEPEMALQM